MTEIFGGERILSKTSTSTVKNSKSKCMKKLTHLYMNDKSIDKISDLSTCARLKVLYLHSNNIEKIENLSIKLLNLTHLYLQWNKIKKIENLNILKNLKKLYLGNNEIICLENLNGLKKLEELHIERQRLTDNQEFEININSIDDIAGCLKLINITKLKLKSLQSIENLYGLETLIAAENNFQCAEELGKSLGHLRLLKNATLHSCPAQKDIHYRVKITAGSELLQNLDGKLISKYTRTFIKNFEQVKKERKSSVQINKDFENKAALDNNTGSLPIITLQNNFYDGVVYKTWNSLNTSNKTRKKRTTGHFVRNCVNSKNIDPDTILQGPTVQNINIK